MAMRTASCSSIAYPDFRSYDLSAPVSPYVSTKRSGKSTLHGVHVFVGQRHLLGQFEAQPLQQDLLVIVGPRWVRYESTMAKYE